MFPADGTGKYYNHNFIVIFDDAGHPFWIENSWKQNPKERMIIEEIIQYLETILLKNIE
jgi:hypothetical protein